MIKYNEIISILTNLTQIFYSICINAQTVNTYNLLALENSKEGLTEERICLAFQAFDELIPKLGVFMQIFQKLRNDLFGMTYFAVSF